MVRIWVSTALLLLLAAAPTRAEDREMVGGGWQAEVIRIHVRPGHEAEIERFLAKLVEGARRTGEQVRWRTHRQIDGERPVYLVVLRAATAAELEAWQSLSATATLEQAYGADEARDLLALREAALESIQRERFVAQPALSLED
jgi:hypothetical protein